MAKDNLWFSSEIKCFFNEKTFLFTTYEKRYNELDFVDGYVEQFSLGAEKKIIGNFSMAISYKREVTRNVIHENRYVVGLKYKISYVDVRFRIEDRNYEESEKINHMNYRFRIRFKYKIGIFKPYIATEPMYNDLTNEFWRNRFYTGIGFDISDQEFFIGVMRQDTKYKEAINALHFGISINIK